MRISESPPKQRLITYLKYFFGVSTILSILIYPISITRADYVVPVDKTTNEYAKLLVEKEFADDSEMLRIVKCESSFRQYDDKGVLIGITGDVGIMQIAPQYWLKEARELGYDIFTTEGNIKMAKVILEKQGHKAWACSQKIAGWGNGNPRGS